MLLGALMLGALGASPALAVGGEASRAFRNGIDAADRGQWQKVIDEMGRALALEPKPGGQIKIYGMRFEAYVPHYWLAMAHDELGDCAKAVEAIEGGGSAAELEALLGPEPWRQIDARMNRCRAELTRLAELRPPPQEALAISESAATAAEADSRRPAPPFLRRAAANYLAGQYEEVRTALEKLDVQTEDPRALATGLLLRGAARFALYRKQDSPDEALLAAARRDLASFRRLRPGHRPSAFWFSPALLELYDDPVAH